jgi:hypothetical protein
LAIILLLLAVLVEVVLVVEVGRLIRQQVLQLQVDQVQKTPVAVVVVVLAEETVVLE